MDEIKKEVRALTNAITSNDEQLEGRVVEGYALRFGQPSQDMGFIETISPDAISEETIKNSDIYARLNHREDTVLARSRYGEGSLELEIDEFGLKYRFVAPNTELGDTLLEHLRRKEISSSSFAFSLDANDKNCQRWYRDENKTLCREIKKIHRLYDVSPVFEPAYLSTSCSARDAEDAMVEFAETVEKTMDENDSLIDGL